jgi:hypothetical protein
MAILSNINDKFAVDSTGAIKFNGQAGTSGYILKSNGNAAPTWVDPDTVIGGPYLPLTGGTLTGNLAINGSNSLTVGGVISAGGTITCNNVGSDKKIAFRRTGANNFSIEHDSAFIYFYNETTSNVIFKMANNNDVTFTGDITTSGKVNAGDRIKTEATTSNALLQVKYNSSNYLEGYYDKLNVVGGDFLLQRGGDTKIKLTAVGTTFTNLSNTSAASSSVDEIKIGTFGAGRPAIYFGSSNTTYTNSTWFIENIGAAGKLRIGRNGLDIVEIFNNGSTTFAGDLSSSGTSKSLKYWRRLWTDANNDWGLNNNAGSGVISVSGMGTPSTSTTTFAGLITTETGGSVFGGSGSIPIYARSTGTVSYMQFQTSSTGSNGSNDGLTVGVNGSTAYIWQRENEDIHIGTNNTSAVTIDNSQNVGIGLTDPEDRLQIDHPGNPTAIRIGDNTTDDCYVIFNTDGNDWSIGTDRSDSNKFKISDYSRVGTNDRLVIDTSGNVGIGTTVPSYKLEVNGGTALVGGGFYVSNDQTVLTSSTYTFRDAVYINNPNSTSAAVSANSVMSIGASSGNSVNTSLITTGAIGIGTASPSNKLEVAGNINVIAPNPYIWIGESGSGGGAGFIGWNDAGDYLFLGHSYGSAFNKNIVINSSGNVGIGTSTPDDFDGESRNLVIRGGVNGSTPTIGMTIATDGNQASSGRCAIRFADGINGNERYRGAIEYNHNGDDMSFRTAGTQKMTLTDDGNLLITSGNVGIGNTAPQTTLHTGPTTTITNAFTARFAASNFFANGGNSMFYVPDTAANIMMFGSNQLGTNQIEFYHKNPGTSQSYVGRISTSGSATSYVTSSDYRLKENIVPISNSISRLNQLKPSRFNFIEEPNKTVDGFIAHEVQNIVPEAIVGKKDAVNEDGSIIPQGIDQAKLVPLLVAAIQELEARVKELENK